MQEQIIEASEIIHAPPTQNRTLLLVFFMMVLSIGTGFAAYHIGYKNGQEKIMSDKTLYFSNQSPQPTNTIESSPSTSVSIDNNSVKQYGDWKLEVRSYFEVAANLNVADLYLVNLSTNEELTLGPVEFDTEEFGFSSDGKYIYYLSAGGCDSPLCSPNVVIYSIETRQPVVSRSLGEIKEQFPNLQIPRNAELHAFSFSPNNSKMAFTYGYPDELDNSGDIFLLDLSNKQLSLLPIKGRSADWQNASTLNYLIIGDPEPGMEFGEIITKSIRID